MEQGDGDYVDLARIAGFAQNLAGGGLIQRQLYFAGVQYSFFDFVSAVTRHQGRSVLGKVVVELGAFLPDDQQYIPKSLGHQEPDPRPLALEYGIGGDRGSVDQKADVFRTPPRLLENAT